MKRIAILDLGTNTFYLLIVEISNSVDYKIIYKNKFAVKIGQGGLVSGQLLSEAMQRGKEAIAKHQKVISEYHCDKVFAFATSAIRSSSNGQQFVKEVKQELGLDINVIDGNEEAQLIYEGVRMAVTFAERPSLIMDIGGGSTEFIIANKSGVLWKKSYDLGVSRILQLLNPNDPLSDIDIAGLNDFLNSELQQLLSECRIHKVNELIGSSGSFDSFMEMMWAKNGIRKKTKSIISEKIDLPELALLHEQLVRTDTAQRAGIPGLVKMRVDTIHLASFMVQWVLRECNLNKLLLSTYALKEGVIRGIVQNR
ncbi:MAG: hypothetical protein JKX84_04920 [Flavobacteriales bacterium]|nr:hypothetical protein [Flavobacteriales bacterium]